VSCAVGFRLPHQSEVCSFIYDISRVCLKCILQGLCIEVQFLMEGEVYLSKGVLVFARIHKLAKGGFIYLHRSATG
jgi:hypothetical protein